MKKYIVKDLTANKEYSSLKDLFEELGIDCLKAGSTRARFQENIEANNGVYKVNPRCRKNSNLFKIDNHRFEIVGKETNIKEEKVMAKTNKVYTEDNLRIAPKPVKKIYAEHVNIRMNKMFFRMVHEMGMDTGTNEIAIVDMNTGVIYPSMTKCVAIIGDKLSKQEQKVLYTYVRKSCVTKTPIAVEKSRNNSAAFMSQFEGHTFNYLSDHKVSEIPQLKKRHIEGVREELMVAVAIKELTSNKIIELTTDMNNLKEVERNADIKIAMYTKMLNKK